MQGDLLSGLEEQELEVIEIRQQKFGDFYWPIYVHTRPKNWLGPEVGEGLPWEE